MSFQSQSFYQWRIISAEERRRIGVGLAVILMLLLLGIGGWLMVTSTIKNSNESAFYFMNQFILGLSQKETSLSSVDLNLIISLQKELKKLSPQAGELKEARSHLIRALSYLYKELEAEVEFARYAGSQQYEKAKNASQKMDEAHTKYILEYKKAEAYINKYRKKTGRKPIFSEFPEER